jgi:hypothetical protein
MSASLAIRCFVVPRLFTNHPMQCWLVLCRKRKMITSSRSRLSITTPRTGSRPTANTARLWHPTRPRSIRVGGRLTNSNLQAGVQNEPSPAMLFLTKTLQARTSTQDVFGKRASNIWACGKENSLRTAKSLHSFGIGEQSPSLPCSQIPCPCSFSYLMCRHAALCSNTTSPGPRIVACRPFQ